MYSKQDASLVKKKFWTSLGQYMRPLPGASGEAVNWLNYKTGVKHLYFRMDADKQQASIAIELKQDDATIRHHYLQQLQQVKGILEQITGEQWEWISDEPDEHGNMISRIGTTLRSINIFNEADWPAIISFLKPRMIALDEFWDLVRERFV